MINYKSIHDGLFAQIGYYNGPDISSGSQADVGFTR
jgi:hypothetical protein